MKGIDTEIHYSRSAKENAQETKDPISGYASADALEADEE